MAQAKATDRTAASAGLSRHVAGLLLAGTMLAALPALAQEPPAGEPVFADPLAGQALTAPADTDTLDAEDENTRTTATRRTTTAGEDALADPLTAGANEDTTSRIARDGLRQNLRENTVDGLRPGGGIDRDEAPGIRLGTFILKPSLSQGIGTERNKSGATSTSRTYSQTGFRGSLTSDWSRHQLTIDTDGVYQRNISGSGEPEPAFRVGADLRLDLADDTVANLRAGYDFRRESSSDPNAVAGAEAQSGVHGFTGGASLTRDFGLIRGTAGLDLRREVYGAARLANGTELSLSDRDNIEGTLTGRIGYELSPALIPYLEASVGRAVYDERRDSLGYARDSRTVGGRVGVEVDLGEKLRGDLGVGYKHTTFEDSRLAAIGAATVDGAVMWSPQRGTDLRLGFATSIEPSTAAGQGGYVSYETNAELAHELRDNLVARLSSAYTWRDMPTALGPDQHIYRVGAGLTWDINRWLALTGDVSYELTKQARAADTGVTRAGIGLVLRR